MFFDKKDRSNHIAGESLREKLLIHAGLHGSAARRYSPSDRGDHRPHAVFWTMVDVVLFLGISHPTVVRRIQKYVKQKPEI